MVIRFGQLKSKLFSPFFPPPPLYLVSSVFHLHSSSLKRTLRLSPSSSLPRWWVHDTFISYKQADTRHFVSHLYDALERHKIWAFVDHNMERGLEIAPSIDEAIERSRSAVVIISQNYASSPWCLDELVKILQCRDKKGQMVFPIFVDVDPREMREQSGPFTQIGQSENGFGQENADRVQRWREALRKAGNLTSWPLGNRY